MAAKEIIVKKYVARLSDDEREQLATLIRKGRNPAQRLMKARILLKADVSEAGEGWSDNQIIEALETSASMVYRVADIHFLTAKKILLVQDNLNTHTKASLYEEFPPPKQGGWPNGSNGTTLQSTAVGSIWRSPNSASFRPSASIAASRINKPSSTKSQRGRMIEMPATPMPTGRSPQWTPVSNSSIYTRQSE
jgi:hypothetical protein